jgi:hypothetical protein
MILSIVMATLVGMLWACVGMLWAYEERFEVIKNYGNSFEICRPTL